MTFHEHLDECARCRNQPFGLCPEGAALLRQDALKLKAPQYKCEHCKDTGLYDARCRPHLCDCEAGREKKFQEWAGFDGTGWEP